MARIAIVIGVNKPKKLTPLQGAVTDALAFGVWIAKQGFDEVKTFTDDKNAVAYQDIFAEVDRVVKAATYSQLVIYFAATVSRTAAPRFGCSRVRRTIRARRSRGSLGDGFPGERPHQRRVHLGCLPIDPLRDAGQQRLWHLDLSQ